MDEGAARGTLPARGSPGWRASRFHLFVAFAFTVMADPVSSVAYANEAALRALDGDLSDLFVTMAIVIGTIAVIAATYHQLMGRFPAGGGGALALGTAFGEGWAFLPLGALLVDFTLTVAISSAAGASAVIAYVPELADWRVPLALGLAALVAAGICLGHRGRVAFATVTLGFIALAAVVIARGFVSGVPDPGSVSDGGDGPLIANAAILAALLAVPFGMALATGVEAPSDAIAQLPQLRDRGRRLFGRLTVWLMLAIVGLLTLSLSALAVHLGVGLPPPDSTMLAEIGRRATGGGGLFAAFQAASALLLLAAAASSYLAASGLMKALALHGGERDGLLPKRLGTTNRWFVPHWGIAVVLVVAAVLLLLAGGKEREIVHFYAVAVFAAFLGALLGCARLSLRDGQTGAFAVNVTGLVLVVLVLAVNLSRADAVIALAAAALIALYLRGVWIRHGRPAGVARLGAG